MIAINLLSMLPPNSNLKPLVLIYKGPKGIKAHYGALMDETHFVVWRSENGHSKTNDAHKDALTKLDAYNRR